jgi:hypothetical protein
MHLIMNCTFVAQPIFTVALFCVQANAEIVLKIGYDHTSFPLYNLQLSYLLMLCNLSS